MAKLDMRLLPLVETLTASGAGWLAFELAEGIRSGRVVEETPDALERARSFVREGRFGSSAISEDSEQVSHPVQPIVGDEQIDWAIHYVETRMEETVAMLVNAIDGLDEIMKKPRTEKHSDAGLAASEITLVLKEDEVFLTVDRSRALEALSEIQALKSALRDWGATVRGG